MLEKRSRSTYRETSHEVDAVRDIDEVGVESDSRYVVMIATAGTSLGAVVGSVLQEVGEVVDDLFCVAVGQALAR